MQQLNMQRIITFEEIKQSVDIIHTNKQRRTKDKQLPELWEFMPTDDSSTTNKKLAVKVFKEMCGHSGIDINHYIVKQFIGYIKCGRDVASGKEIMNRRDMDIMGNYGLRGSSTKVCTKKKKETQVKVLQQPIVEKVVEKVVENIAIEEIPDSWEDL